MKRMHNRVFNSHWAMRDVIINALDTLDSAEQTKPTEFRLILKVLLRGLITSRKGRYDENTYGDSLSKLREYASRPKASRTTECRMTRFLGLMDAEDDDLSGGALEVVGVIAPRLLLAISVTV